MALVETVLAPTREDGWRRRMLVGGLLVLGWFLIVPLAIVHGYLVRVMREGAGAPLGEDPTALIRDGIAVWAIALVYLAIPLITGAITVGAAVRAIRTGTAEGTLLALTGVLAGGGLTVLWGLCLGYLAIGGIVTYAHRGRLVDAFSPRLLAQFIPSRPFAIAFAVSLVCLGVAGIVGAIPLVGWALMPFLFFYALVVSAHLWAQGYTTARQRPL